MAYKIKKDPISKIPKAQFVFWIIVRIAMIICAIYSFAHGDMVMGFESVFGFIGIVIGSYFGFFDKISWFDNFMHIVSGLVCAVFGYDFACVIQRKKGQCAATLAAIFSLMFALSIAVGWEFYEFLMDYFHGTNLQLAKAGAETAMFDLSKYHNEYGYLGLVDTMTDMMMNAIGGIAGMVFMIVLRNRKKDKKK